ncbi:hypothetical protein G6M02_19670 [Agrobacterium rhizogenes]|nr:hypothetical protein [Rhizobium rhizogenes]
MHDLLDAQSRIQSEADEVVQMLELNELLNEVGYPTRVGSSALGLMVRRDIDITVTCSLLDDATLSAFGGLGARLMQRRDCVSSVRFRNDTRDWNTEPQKYPDGLYLWLSVRTSDGNVWTVDIWLVDKPEMQQDLIHLKTLLPRLSDADRVVILGIKHFLVNGDRDMAKIPSALVYEAVMDHSVKTPEEFKRWYDVYRS